MNRMVLLLPAAVTMLLIGCAASDDPVKARNVEVVQVVFAEIWSKRNVDLIGDVFAEDFVGHFPAKMNMIANDQELAVTLERIAKFQRQVSVSALRLLSRRLVLTCI